MKKEKAELIQEALDTLQAVTLSGRSTEGYVAELFEDIRNLEEENKKLKEENEYRKKIADVLPEGEGHIAEETIQDLQKEIKKLKEDVDYRHHRCMKAERQVQHSLGGDDEEGLYE